MKTILCVSANPRAARSVAALLSRRGHQTRCAGIRELRIEARRHSASAVILESRHPPPETESLARELAAEGRAFILLSEKSSAGFSETSVGFFPMRRVCGLPPDIAEIEAALSEVLDGEQDQEGPWAENPAHPFLGSTPIIIETAHLLRNYARSEYPVLVIGESGTGKEVAASAIRSLSSRGGGPFVAWNCAALPESLAESELFGSEAGAFTGAIARAGAFEQAHKGHIFLDEISEMSLSIQAKLLRVLETKKVQRLGGQRLINADIRLISASNRNLNAAVMDKTFRQDLYYRISILILELPPLRERREDIAKIAEHFALEDSKGRTLPSPGALEKLADYEWPGNIRELKNVIQRALVLAGETEELLPEHIRFL